MKPLTLFLLLIFFLSHSYASTDVATYQDKCLQCLMANNDFCSATDPTYYTAGHCCSQMASDTDYCNAGFTYCTLKQTSAGAKFAKCALSTSCGSVSSFLIVKGQIKTYSVKISAAGICNYQLYYSLTDPNTNFNYIDQQSYAKQLTGG